MPSSNSIVRKAIIVIAVELEKEMTDQYIAEEACRRLSMHPHIKDANWVQLKVATGDAKVTVNNDIGRNFIGSKDGDTKR